MPIYMDQAATSWPKPEPVAEAVASFITHLGGNPGRSSHGAALQADRLILEARELVAQLLGAGDPREIVFTLNATDALNMAIKGVTRPGGHAITTSMEHNSVMRPLASLAQRGEIRLTVVQADRAGWVNPEDIRAAIQPDTYLIAMTHASNVIGTIQPIAQVGEIAKSRGIIFLVDGAQSAGALPVDVQAANVDLFAFAGHKGLLGPQGTGGLYVRSGLLPRPWREGGTGSHSELDHMPEVLPDRLEGGTPNTPGIAGLAASVKHLLATGIDNIREQEKELTARFLKGLAEIPKVIVYGPADPAARVAVVSLNIEGQDNGLLGFVLAENYGIMVRTGLHCAPHAHRTLGTFPEGAIRFSFHTCNTEDQIDQALAAIREIASQS